MRARWTSDPCYAFYGVDGSDCSFLIYLSEVEWFCPPLAWRNQTATPTLKPPPKKQVTCSIWSRLISHSLQRVWAALLLSGKRTAWFSHLLSARDPSVNSVCLNVYWQKKVTTAGAHRSLKSLRASKCVVNFFTATILTPPFLCRDCSTS